MAAGQEVTEKEREEGNVTYFHIPEFKSFYYTSVI